MALLSTPAVRAVLASPDPKIDVGRLFAEKKRPPISTAPGVRGEGAAPRWSGRALISVIWSAIEARVALRPDKRHPVFLFIDELATVTNGVPYSWELVAERARGLGAGLTVAIQTSGPNPGADQILDRGECGDFYYVQSRRGCPAVGEATRAPNGGRHQGLGALRGGSQNRNGSR